MSDQVYLTDGSQQLGPFTLDQIRTMLAQRQATPEMMCWHSGLAGWTQLATAFPQLAAAGPAPAPAPPVAAAPAGRTRFEVLKKDYWQLPKITVENAEVVLEAGALHYLRGSIQIEAKLPSAGGFIRAKLTGERAVRPRYRGTGEIYLEPTFAEVNVLELNGETWVLDKGAFLAADASVEVGMFTNKAMSGLFGGEGFFQTQVSGRGSVFYLSPGPLERLDLVNDTLVVDGSFAVARTGNLEFAVEKTTKGLFSSMASGEGLVNTFRGTGTVLIAPVPNRFLTLKDEFGGLRSLIAGMSRG